ncbi:MAG: taurine catabolism dioxygenase TauD [Rhodospirillaceae bacterium]|nr:taurine catabolism dioxygenase TauD [Rhodospirillaceae bacterium]|tara:strand:+ start:20181 stop:21038 length:858 start_codon:yes stop_codon:yes gene_type:complete
MTLEIIPSKSSCGAEIRGINLKAQLSAEDSLAIYHAWLKYLVIYFRGQNLGENEHLRFTKYFGTPGDYMRPDNLKTNRMKKRHPAVMFISNIRENGEPIGALPDGEMMFHTDTAYDHHLHKATTLYSLEVPEKGGETIFSNQYAVYEALPGNLKSLLKGRDAYTAYEFGTTVKTKPKYDHKEKQSAMHPVFRLHEETGRMAVFVNELMTEEIEGLDKAQNIEILKKIFDLQRKPQFCYEHRWEVGDLIIWDNRCSLHARRDFPSDQRRLMRRITVQGNRPVYKGE